MARAGRFRHLLTLERSGVVEVGPGGTPIVRWDVEGSFFGNVTTLSGRELEIAQQTEPRAQVEIVARYEPDTFPKAKDRLLHEGRVFNVYACFKEDDRNDTMRITAGEKP